MGLPLNEASRFEIEVLRMDFLDILVNVVL